MHLDLLPVFRIVRRPRPEAVESTLTGGRSDAGGVVVEGPWGDVPRQGNVAPLSHQRWSSAITVHGDLKAAARTASPPAPAGMTPAPIRRVTMRRVIHCVGGVICEDLDNSGTQSPHGVDWPRGREICGSHPAPGIALGGDGGGRGARRSHCQNVRRGRRGGGGGPAVMPPPRTEPAISTRSWTGTPGPGGSGSVTPPPCIEMSPASTTMPGLVICHGGLTCAFLQARCPVPSPAPGQS
jgi:hypothetical protein